MLFRSLDSDFYKERVSAHLFDQYLSSILLPSLLCLSLLSFFAHCADPMIRWVVVVLRPGFGKARKNSSCGFNPYCQVFRARCWIVCALLVPIVRYPFEVLCELLLLLWLIAQLSLMCPAWHLRLLGPDAPVRRLSVTPRNK